VNASQLTSQGVLTGALGPSTGGLLPGSITSAVLFPPTLPVLDETVPGGYTFEDDRGRNLPNPVADAQESDNINNNSRIIGSLFTEWTLIDDLVFKINLGIDGFSSKDNRFVPNYLKRTEPNNGDAVVSTVDGFTWLTEYTLNYNKKFNADHALNALAGYTRQAFRSERLNAVTLDFPDNTFGWHNLRSGLNPQPSSTAENDWGIVSYLGRVNYNLKSKYLITATARIDGSSRFGENSKYGFFPSLAFAWNIADEAFFNQNDFFQSFKMRTSIGVIGNSEIGSFNSLATVGPRGEGTFNNDEPYIGSAPLRLPNPELRWERTAQFNLGFDIAFFDARVIVTTDYYNQRTTDLLLFRPIPNTTGFSNFFDNIGELKNEGIELSIDGLIVEERPITWRATFNISSNRNEILKLADNNDIPAPGVLQVPAGWNIVRVGQPLGTFFGLISDGIFQSDDEAQSSALLVGQTPQAGQRKYRDINGRDEQGNLTGQPDGIINEADRTILGQAQPKFTWNMTNTFEYKGIDFSFFIQASHGNDIINAYQFELGALTGETNVYREAYLNRWTPDNPSNEYPRLDPTDRGVFSSAQVEDGTFVRLRNATLGYTLPSKLLSKMRLSRMRVYCTGSNLFTLTDYSGYDPEVNAFGQNALLLGIDYGGYPLARSFIAGIQIGI
jgi:TonB-linked SusC/RagA family outer membrane protein